MIDGGTVYAVLPRNGGDGFPGKESGEDLVLNNGELGHGSPRRQKSHGVARILGCTLVEMIDNAEVMSDDPDVIRPRASFAGPQREIKKEASPPTGRI
jgi:hypothetical protein